VGGTTTRPVTYKPYYSREANVSFRNSSHNAKNIYARADNNNLQNFSVFFIKKMAADSVLVTNLVLQIKGGMMAIFIFRYTFE
jgi:hypothetical protein